MIIKENHRYYYDDKEIPSVTKVIALLNPDKFKFVNPELLEEKSNFGTEVHLATYEFDNGSYNWLFYEDKVDDYVKQYERFCKDYDYEKIESEISLYHKKHKYAGTIDRICKVNGKEYVLDIKTGSFYKEHIIQVSAYIKLANANGYNVKNGLLLYLKDNDYKVYEVKNVSYNYYVFRSLLVIYNYLNKKRERDVKKK